MKYLTELEPGIWHLSHQLTPEVRAMLSAMTSRMPLGGMLARYTSLLEAVGDENLLTTYPLPAKVQEFFDQFVGMYGHSSILELTGDPAIFVERVSWWAAWNLFDSPLVQGQENSTRAVSRKNWPLPRDIDHDEELVALHNEFMEVYEAETAEWTKLLADADFRASLGIADKEPFRPALDRARWALPGTTSTGVTITSHVRERARVIRDAKGISHETARHFWEELESAYKKAVPGLAKYGFRESVYSVSQPPPKHLNVGLRYGDASYDANLFLSGEFWSATHRRDSQRTYLDPAFNDVTVTFMLPCSLAVARDWHRHRTLYPLEIDVISHEDSFVLHPDYYPVSELGKEKVHDLFRRAHAYYVAHPGWQGIAAIPFGAMVCLEGTGGLRDFVYTMELRRDTHGANFEYKRQATLMIELLKEAISTDPYMNLGDIFNEPC